RADAASTSGIAVAGAERRAGPRPFAGWGGCDRRSARAGVPAGGGERAPRPPGAPYERAAAVLRRERVGGRPGAGPQRDPVAPRSGRSRAVRLRAVSRAVGAGGAGGGAGGDRGQRARSVGGRRAPAGPRRPAVGALGRRHRRRRAARRRSRRRRARSRRPGGDRAGEARMSGTPAPEREVVLHVTVGPRALLAALLVVVLLGTVVGLASRRDGHRRAARAVPSAAESPAQAAGSRALALVRFDWQQLGYRIRFAERRQ